MLSNDIELSGEPQCQKKREDGTRVRCSELLCGRCPSARLSHTEYMRTTYLESGAGKP